MKTAIIGIAVICLVLIGGVYAFGPHTRYDRGPECIYYFGPGNSCLVDDMYCNADGTNNYVMLEDKACISQKTPTIIPEEPITEEVPPPLPTQPTQAVPAETTEPIEQKSYLWLLIPMLLIFAIAVILLLLWLDTRGKYFETKSTLTRTRRQKTALGATLLKTKRKSATEKRKLSTALATQKRKKTRAYCPRDGAAMRKSGSIKQGPRGGQRQMYVCPECGHRTMKTVKP